jgi:peptidoglycan/xylan/chitin deacetylase (PgdA/CDA1 family)
MIKALAALAAALALGFAPAALAQPGYAWPEGRRAAIALTYDDSAPSQLQFAIPALNQAGLKGAFFLTGANMTAEHIPAWRAAAAAGHELANHTLHHPCRKGTYDMPERYTSEAYDVATMLGEIRTMNAFLTALDGKPTHAFGAPCGHKTSGGEDYYGPLIASGLATYFRDEGVPPVAARMPPAMVAAPDGTSGADMVAWAERVRASGAFGIVVFHGVGGDYLSVSDAAHRELLAYLAAHPDIWTARFSDVMDYIKTSGE